MAEQDESHSVYLSLDDQLPNRDKPSGFAWELTSCPEMLPIHNRSQIKCPA